ncbi:hypothetical protein FRC12_001299 [Ceratobasidium sp. 428]|nr:hypothetical protein FRC12_001299 [Ceratobasidium sp. 428]
MMRGYGGKWEAEQPQAGGNAAADPLHFHPVPEYVIAKTPTILNVPLAYLAEHHGAPKIHTALRTFVKRACPGTTNADVEADFKLKLWSRARLVHSPPPFKRSEGPSLNVIRAWPKKIDRFQRICHPAWFDTVLVLMYPNRSGIQRYCAGRMKAIFEIPQRRELYEGKLAYIEMFNKIPPQPEAPVGLFTSTQSIQHGQRIAAVFPLEDLRLTCHLAPHYCSFHPALKLLYYSDVLQLCKTFYINAFASYFWYELIRHWGQQGGET